MCWSQSNWQWFNFHFFSFYKSLEIIFVEKNLIWLRYFSIFWKKNENLPKKKSPTLFNEINRYIKTQKNVCIWSKFTDANIILSGKLHLKMEKNYSIQFCLSSILRIPIGNYWIVHSNCRHTLACFINCTEISNFFHQNYFVRICFLSFSAVNSFLQKFVQKQKK